MAEMNGPYQDQAAITNLIGRVGVMVLRSGGASFRTEDIMRRVAKSLKVEIHAMETLVTPTVISVTTHFQINGTATSYTTTQKVGGLGVNMARIEALHDVSRYDYPPEQLAVHLDEIENINPLYSHELVMLGVGLACGSFAIILGGGFPEFIASMLAAMVSQLVRFRWNRLKMNPYLVTNLCSIVATGISYALDTFIFHAPNTRLAMIASVLLLVPGVPLIDALIDLIQLDLISGVTRGIYATFILISIGIGVLTTLSLTGIGIS